MVDHQGEVTPLSDTCRIIVGACGPISTQFSIWLQSACANGFMTIAAYEAVLGRTRRLIFRPDGTYQRLDIDLPLAVAIEMARRDFSCNWLEYHHEYCRASSSLSLANVIDPDFGDRWR